VCAGFGTIALVSVVFLVAAVVWVSIRGPVYEATAYAEVDAAADIATIEQKLRFPSLYAKVTDSAEAARDLAQRTRVKALRDSQLIAVTVSDGDPARAAASADGIVEGFIGADAPVESAEELRARIQAINELSDSSSSTSPAVLLEAWRIHDAGAKEAAQAGDDPAVELAEKKRQQLKSRIEEYLKSRRPQLGLPELEPHDDFDPESALETTITELGELYAKRGELDARARQLESGVSFEKPSAGVRLIEPATAPTQPGGPGALMVCLGAVVLGGFSGVLLVLLRTA